MNGVKIYMYKTLNLLVKVNSDMWDLTIYFNIKKTNGLLKTQAFEENIKNKILVINILSVPPKALLILIAKLFILWKNKLRTVLLVA